MPLEGPNSTRRVWEAPPPPPEVHRTAGLCASPVLCGVCNCRCPPPTLHRNVGMVWQVRRHHPPPPPSVRPSLLPSPHPSVAVSVSDLQLACISKKSVSCVLCIPFFRVSHCIPNLCRVYPTVPQPICVVIFPLLMAHAIKQMSLKSGSSSGPNCTPGEAPGGSGADQSSSSSSDRPSKKRKRVAKGQREHMWKQQHERTFQQC